MLVIEVIDWAITAKEGVDCVNGSGDACGSVAMSVALSVVPGPSPKWIGRIWDGVKSLANVKKVENIVTVAKTAEKAVEKLDTFVYKGVDNDGVVRYIGISSQPDVRFKQHMSSKSPRAALNFEVVSTTITRSKARITEQTLINQYGMSKNGGQLYNKINSIAPTKWAGCGITRSCL